VVFVFMILDKTYFAKRFIEHTFDFLHKKEPFRDEINGSSEFILIL
jgi:hypothetical protein